MRVICDAPGQTCNRLWTYVTSVARCIAEKKRMVIIFFDWTIEDFPNLLHCKFIYFPLYHKWYLERGNGWNNYKGLTWKVTHNKTWDKVFKFLGFTKGWQTRTDTRYLRQTLPELKRIFRPSDAIMQKAEAMVAELKKESDMVVGVHIRRGDYATWNDGRFFFELEEYHQFMLRVKELYQDQTVSFFISSNENFDLDLFDGCRCRRFGNEPSGAILDLYTLSLCDRIIGPFSSYSRWASFIGEVPLCFLESKDQQFTADSFSKIVDFFHFENGKEIYDW
ncbi:MAG: alpha-1,2-fucosyltransferase [Prevotella sp.]|nr:alpha-1,2-fucosyltransferase [Prevotella sp.]